MDLFPGFIVIINFYYFISQLDKTKLNLLVAVFVNVFTNGKCSPFSGQHKCYIVATCDRDLKRRIRKVREINIKCMF